jgi:HEAT repeat protein
MIANSADSGKEFPHSVGNGAKAKTPGLAQTCLQIGVGAVVLLISYAVLAPVLRDAGDENRRRAIAAAHALDRAQDAAHRVQAIHELVGSPLIDGPVAIPPLVRSLDDPDVQVRVAAAGSLGPATSAVAVTGSGDKLVNAAIAALTRSLDDPEPGVRIAAVYALGSIAASKNPSGVIHPQPLVDALVVLLDDSDPMVRFSAIVALGVAGPLAAPDPPAALIETLEDESSNNRAQLVRALASFPK